FDRFCMAPGTLKIETEHAIVKRLLEKSAQIKAASDLYRLNDNAEAIELASKILELHKPKEGDLPTLLLADVHWNFLEPQHKSKETFFSSVNKGQIELDGDEWNPDEIIMQIPKIAIQFFYYKNDDYKEPTIKLVADDGVSFSAGELLYKLHASVAGLLDSSDHHFFEGLVLVPGTDHEGLPLYRINQGS
ncbi:MAG: hypothetical protein ABW100_05235, partial [Candidatus Thiodiazotropha sp. 6PLUC3]